MSERLPYDRIPVCPVCGGRIVFSKGTLGLDIECETCHSHMSEIGVNKVTIYSQRIEFSQKYGERPRPISEWNGIVAGIDSPRNDIDKDLHQPHQKVKPWVWGMTVIIALVIVAAGFMLWNTRTETVTVEVVYSGTYVIAYTFNGEMVSETHSGTWSRSFTVQAGQQLAVSAVKADGTASVISLTLYDGVLYGGGKILKHSESSLPLGTTAIAYTL